MVSHGPFVSTFLLASFVIQDSIKDRDSRRMSAALRSALRPVLRAVLKRPGALYQPLYVGPIASLDSIEADVQGIAEAEGIPVYIGFTVDVQHAIGGGGRGVLIVAVNDAADLLAARATLPLAGQQVILWGNVEASELPAAIRDWVKEGLAFDPAAYARPIGSESSMGPTLARCAREPGRLYNPVLLVGPTVSHPFIADEAMLRLEAGGIKRVLTFSGPFSVDEVALSRVRQGGGVIVRLPAGLPLGDEAQSFRSAVEELVQAGVQVVIVADSRAPEQIARDAAWKPAFSRGVTLVVAAERRAVSPAPSGDVKSGHVWPAVSDLLVGPPRVGEAVTRMMNTRSFGIGDLLQLFAMGRFTARLAVYTTCRIGWIDFEQGVIVAAGYEGDRWNLSELLARRGADRKDEEWRMTTMRQLIEERVCHIGAWRDAHYVLFAHEGEPDGERVSLPVSAVVLEVAKRTDEAPRRLRKTGGLGQVWRKVPDRGELENLGSFASRLWSALDGQRTLAEAAWTAGLLDQEALDAVLALQSAGLIEKVGAPKPIRENLCAGAVARVLLQWGLDIEAREILEEAVELEVADREAHFLRGHLESDRDTRTALMAFRAAADGTSGSALGVAAQLNALLLALRLHEMDPLVAWDQFRREIAPKSRSHLSTPRHYGIVAELALRAGDLNYAEQLIRVLKSAPGEDASRIRTALEAALTRIRRSS